MAGSINKWRFAIDRGGTFTDIIAFDPQSTFRSLKILSDCPHYKDASIEGIRRILGVTPGEPLPADRIDGIRIGTTVATNALLERKGGNTVLLITEGFADLLEIGYQNRPDIFELCIRKSPPLYSSIVEVPERIDCRGCVIRPFDAQKLLTALRKIELGEADSVAVVLMHSWKNPSHELLCESVLKDAGFEKRVVLSHKAIDMIKIVSRGQSALIDAYLSTVLSAYLDDIREETADIPVSFMQSNGALSPPELFTGKSALLSGPAGGARAAAKIAEEAGLNRAIGFDMGGTSTDVSRFDGRFERTYDKVIEGIPMQTEMLNIHTVAAGGGSILKFDGQRMTVGPESAGSYPGPACYGFGGPLTVTDANLLTGRLVPSHFPSTFGPDRNSALDLVVVEARFRELSETISAATGICLSGVETAEGFLRIANEKMALAIKEISISKGFDVREYALVCFGGAGGQHACSIARLLDMETIVVHPLGSLMSAYGIGISEPAQRTVQTVLMPYNRETHELLAYKFAALEKHLRFVTEDPSSADGDGNAYITKKEIDLRPVGTDAFLTLRYETFDKTLEEFKKQYARLFGFGTEGIDMEAVNLRLELQRQTTGFFGRYACRAKSAGAALEPALHQRIFYVSGTLDAPVYMREDLPSDAVVRGPAIIVDPHTSVVVDPDFSAAIDSTGIMAITNLRMLNEHISSGIGKPDPVLLEVFNNLFMGIAADMGITLGNTARSVNMKERLDFSCAVFDAGGGLVANAPHIPVHLGAMADTVKAVLLDNTGLMKPGDVYLTNNPYRGGSHLPDLTVVCPVFSEQGKLIFFTASRGHHADIGGNTPGSMPPVASHIDEEGVLIDNFLLVSGGAFREAELREILTSHKYPARNPDTNISDIRAQIASCQKGAQALLSAAGRYGIGTVIAYMRHIQKNAEFSVRRTLCEFLGGRPTLHSTFEDHMDDGSIVRVAVTIDAGANPPETARATIDFAGTGVQHSKDNLNTPSSVTRSAVMYVLRTLTSAAIPLNSGCLSPVDILIPDGSLLMPVFPAPVASGNVETSQRVVDVLLGAFNVAAASQGTMNNLLFQVEGETPYYETIAGGAGATRSCRGASGVQVHMTNTLITDPEVLECRHPGVLLERFSLRKNSGGKGVLSGGDGVVREIKFLKPATVSILSERRVFAPYGIEGGEDGQKGLNLLKKSDGNLQELGPREVFRVDKDDSVIIKTPGGGGYGRAD